MLQWNFALGSSYKINKYFMPIQWKMLYQIKLNINKLVQVPVYIKYDWIYIRSVQVVDLPQ